VSSNLTLSAFSFAGGNFINKHERYKKGFLKAKKLIPIMKLYDDVDNRWFKMAIHTRVMCSKPCCGNPRKYFNESTWQEKKAQLELEQELKELDEIEGLTK
jgi:hypothetical protein